MTLKVILEKALPTAQKVPDAAPSERLLSAVQSAPTHLQEAAVTSVRSKPAATERIREFPRAERLARDLADSIREQDGAAEAHANTHRVDARRYF